MPQDVTDNGQSRFEMPVEGGMAFVSYRRDNGALNLMHAEIPAHLEGQGVGSKLVRGTFDLIRARGEKMRPFCSFVSAYLRRHPEYRDLLAD